MISLVRVALLLNSKAYDAAFLSMADPAIEPNTMGFLGLLPATSEKTTHFFSVKNAKRSSHYACKRKKYKQIDFTPDA